MLTQHYLKNTKETETGENLRVQGNASRRRRREILAFRSDTRRVVRTRAALAQIPPNPALGAAGPAERARPKPEGAVMNERDTSPRLVCQPDCFITQ
ncbi:hypothetical protein EVAR_29653_1 [Eumeta japonica]|uniref:Uncharacterized protein n=1 Tax=Eumeta variegata TaxID=151549 RepID=A0A4C1W821_EUMVA|nr:hypothetical protein EVAR_29653_1 [Eumeta japonica]